MTRSSHPGNPTRRRRVFADTQPQDAAYSRRVPFASASAVDLARSSGTSGVDLLDAIPNEIAVLDAEGRIVQINAAWRTFAERYAAAGLGDLSLGTSYLGAHDALARQGVRKSIVAAEGIRAVLGGARREFDVELQCPAIAERYRVRVRARADGAGAVVTQENVTVLRRVEAEADATAERLRLQLAALNATANAIVIADVTGVIRWANPAFSVLTGFPVSFAAGRRPNELLKSGVHDRAFYQDMWSTILAGDIWRGEVVNKRRDGTRYTEEMTITPVRSAAGAITHFIAVKQDVTQRKQLEEQVRQAQKMESIGRLAGGVAHDFNNQLSVILGYTDVALDALEPAHPVREDLEAVRRAAQRSAELTRQLLTFARQKTVSLRVLDLNEHVTASLRMLERLIGENVRLSWTPGDGLWPVRADATQLDQILTNLCVNARDAINDIGTLRLATTNVMVTAADCGSIPDATPGEYVQLDVTDSGSGIAADVLPSIFEPFFTTKAIGKGTGLGLASVYGAVRQGNGFIRVHSVVGQGTTFTIFLPRHHRS
jgi:PAS domain S-box-containing protein